MKESLSTLDKIKASITRTLSKGMVRAHSKAAPQSINLTIDSLDIEVKGDLCIISLGSSTASFKLTAHWKNGALFPHWIRLNKALIALDSLPASESTFEHHKPVQVMMDRFLKKYPHVRVSSNTSQVG
jgi:hypothetical protein